MRVQFTLLNVHIAPHGCDCCAKSRACGRQLLASRPSAFSEAPWTITSCLSQEEEDAMVAYVEEQEVKQYPLLGSWRDLATLTHSVVSSPNSQPTPAPASVRACARLPRCSALVTARRSPLPLTRCDLCALCLQEGEGSRGDVLLHRGRHDDGRSHGEPARHASEHARRFLLTPPRRVADRRSPLLHLRG